MNGLENDKNTYSEIEVANVCKIWFRRLPFLEAFTKTNKSNKKDTKQ
jgi:hypothetical protein